MYGVCAGRVRCRGTGGVAVNTEDKERSSEYRQYLRSDQWKQMRTKVRRRSRGWCERCKVGRRADIHHLTYERLGHEELTDLIAVCRPCHEWLHGKRSMDPAATTYTAEEIRIIRGYKRSGEWTSFAREYRPQDLGALNKRDQSIGVSL